MHECFIRFQFAHREMCFIISIEFNIKLDELCKAYLQI